jgi:opine dehydrogenase
MPKKKNITVIGAGHGGKAMAAYLGLMEFPIVLFNRTEANVAAIKELGGIYLESVEGGPRGFGKLTKVTSSIAEALEGAEIIMIAVPSTAHADIARSCAPYLTDGQIVILHPGRTCGAIEFTRVIRNNGCTADVTIAEAETFIYACRSDGPAQVRIFRIKEAVPMAALPASRTQLVLDTIHDVYPQFIDGGNVLQTGMNNMGAIFHPALSLLNSGWIESTHGSFQFYIEGVTSSVARVLESLDRERVTVAASIGIRARTGMEWLKLSYDAVGEDLNEAIHNQLGYYGINAPPSLNHRYILEDVPMSLVPIASLGQHYGVMVSGIDAIIKIASIIHNTDYWRRGRTIEKLGINNLSTDELLHYVEEGVLETS